MTFSGSDKNHFWIYAHCCPEINRLISIFGREHSSPNIYSGQAIMFSHMLWIHLEWKCVHISIISVLCFLSVSPPTHRHTIMAFYSSSVLANCCVWLTSRSLSRQVAGYVLFFCKSKQHKVLETGNFPNWAACRSQWTTKALLLVREERGGGEGEDGEWEKTNESLRDENRQHL